MNILKSFFAGLVIATAAPALDATVINFDNLTSDQVIQNGYAGLNWTNFDVYDAVNNPDHLGNSGYNVDGHNVSAISPNNVAFNADANLGAIPVVSSDTVFSLNSVYLHSVWNDGLQVEVIGSLAGFT